MAVYKYYCEKCGEFTIEMPMNKYKRITECPSCKSKVERIINVPNAMIFKGEGFYVNDYKKSKPQEPNKPKETESNQCNKANKQCESKCDCKST